MPAAAATEVVDTTQPAAPPAEPVETTAAQVWTFDRKGQKVEVTDPTQALDLMRQGYDYTQKTMELADQRRAFEAQVAEARSWLANPANLKAMLARVEPQALAPTAPQAPGPDPEALVTVAEQQAALAAATQAAQQQTQEYANRLVQNALLQAETARYAQDYKGQVDTVMKALVTEKFPILQDVEKVDRLILDDVAEKVAAAKAMDANHVATIEEVKGYMVESATRRAGKLESRVKEHLKMEAVRAAKLKTTGTEPPGGTPPPAATTPTTYKLGDKALTASVVAELQAAFDKKR